MRDGWTRTTLAEVADVTGGGTPRTSIPEYWGGAIPWVTPTEITAVDGGIVTETERTITELGLEKSGARMLSAGAVLLTSRATIGAVALAGVPLATNQGFATDTPVIVTDVVRDIDAIVRQVRFTGWNETQEGDRTVRKELRLVLKAYLLPLTGPLFDHAYAYIRENY